MASEEFETIAGDFDFLDEWEDRYRYVIDLGKAMAPLEDELRSEWSKVDGCASQVWIVPEICERKGVRTFNFRGDSDAMIVRGLIAILRSLYNGLTIGDVLSVDARFEIGRLGLANHLSAQRSNGLASMIGRIRELARIASNQESRAARPGICSNVGN